MIDCCSTIPPGCFGCGSGNWFEIILTIFIVGLALWIILFTDLTKTSNIKIKKSRRYKK